MARKDRYRKVRRVLREVPKKIKRYRMKGKVAFDYFNTALVRAKQAV